MAGRERAERERKELTHSGRDLLERLVERPTRLAAGLARLLEVGLLVDERLLELVKDDAEVLDLLLEVLDLALLGVALAVEALEREAVLLGRRLERVDALLDELDLLGLEPDLVVEARDVRVELEHLGVVLLRRAQLLLLVLADVGHADAGAEVVEDGVLLALDDVALGRRLALELLEVALELCDGLLEVGGALAQRLELVLDALEARIGRAQVVLDALQVGLGARLVGEELLLGARVRAVLEALGELAAQLGLATAQRLDLLVLERAAARVRSAAGDGAGAVDDGALERDGCRCKASGHVAEGTRSMRERGRAGRTLDLLAAVVADVARDLHRVAHERVAARKLHGLLDARVEVDDVDGEPSALGERAVLVVDRLHRNRLDRDEGRLPEALHAHVLQGRTSIISLCMQSRLRGERERTHLDAGDGRLLGVDDDRVDVAAEDRRDGGAVLLLGRFAQVDDAAAHAGEGALELGERFLEAALRVLLLTGGAGLLELAQGALELLVVLGLGLPARRGRVSTGSSEGERASEREGRT